MSHMLQHFKAINNYEKSNWNYCKQNQLVKWLTCKHNDMTSYLRNWLNTKQNWQQHSTNNSSKGWWCGFITPALKRLSQADPRVSLVSQCCFTDEGDTLSKDRLQDEWDASVGKMSWSQTWGPLFITLTNMVGEDSLSRIILWLPEIHCGMCDGSSIVNK